MTNTNLEIKPTKHLNPYPLSSLDLAEINTILKVVASDFRNWITTFATGCIAILSKKNPLRVYLTAVEIYSNYKGFIDIIQVSQVRISTSTSVQRSTFNIKVGGKATPRTRAELHQWDASSERQLLQFSDDPRRVIMRSNAVY